jgi:hypothetical protein
MIWPQRPYTAECQFPGLQPFLVGTIWVDRAEHEVSARQRVLTTLAATFPTLPEIIRLLPGSVEFIPDPEPEIAGQAIAA